MARRKQKRQPRGPFYRTNHFIQAQEVRVVDEKSKQVGVMPLGQALKQAQEKGLDLVEIAPKAKPPVCKIIDFKKFKYLEAKKKKEEKKKTKRIEVKQVRLTPFMAENDLNFRLERAEKFLKEGDRVKVSVFFKGRQMTKKQFGYDLLKRSVERLEAFAKVEIEPRFFGRKLEMVFLPLKGGEDGQAKTEDKKVDQKKNQSD